MRGDGFVGAGFRHRTSRAGDPHLHTHVLATNATRSADGRWGALDARHLYLHAKTAGYLYEAHLRAELTARLGVAWGPVVHGIGDIDGIPDPLLKMFWTRRREIEAEMAARGFARRAPPSTQCSTPRQAKTYDVEPSALRTRWAEQTAEIGWDHEQFREVVGQACPVGLTGERIDKIRERLNRRQHEPWERNALAQLRGGKIDDAISTYEARGRIHTLDTAPAARDAMCADWWTATLAGDQVLMHAIRWSDVDDLNARARTRLHDAGRLTGPTLVLDDRPYQAGDRIMTLRNERRLHVRNGTCGQVTDIDAEQRQMTVRTDAGATVTLSARHMDNGHVRRAYATTIHKAQGQTVDRALVLGSDLLHREAGYVALSRGRTENRIYLVGREPREEAHAPEPAPPVPIDALTQSLGVSHAQHLTLDTGIDRHAIGRELQALVHERDRLQEVARQRPPDRAHEIESLTIKRRTTIESL